MASTDPASPARLQTGSDALSLATTDAVKELLERALLSDSGAPLSLMNQSGSSTAAAPVGSGGGEEL